MALIQLPEGTQITGSIGGTTYARNRAGYYKRNRTTPINPNTPLQAASRSYMGQAATAWRSLLTQTQRDEWIAYAAATPKLNKLGQTFYWTGAQAFIASTTFAMHAGTTIIDPTAPWEPGVPEVPAAISDLAIVAAADVTTPPPPDNSVVLDFAEWTGTTVLGTASAFIFWVSGIFGQGVKFHNGPWFAAYVEAGSVGGTETITFPFTIPAGARQFYRWRVLDAQKRLSAFGSTYRDFADVP